MCLQTQEETRPAAAVMLTTRANGTGTKFLLISARKTPKVKLYIQIKSVYI